MLKESASQLYGNEQFEGFAIDLIGELAAMEGFNYTFKIREDKKNGEKLPNGTWTGMIGDLIDHVRNAFLFCSLSIYFVALHSSKVPKYSRCVRQ